jgi:organic hydroperoxide reductase OsmC/OhrA
MSDEQSHRFACHLRWSGASGGMPSYETFSRELTVTFEGKADIVASSAPSFFGDPSLHNPEDLLVAALSTCHALTYLAICAKSGVTVLAYEDDATGTMGRVERINRFTGVRLRPKVTVPKGTNIERARMLHDKAHAHCIIANSVNFPVEHEPTIVEVD